MNTPMTHMWFVPPPICDKCKTQHEGVCAPKLETISIIFCDRCGCNYSIASNQTRKCPTHGSL